MEKNVHPLKLGRSATSNLLDTKPSELSLQLIQLLGKIILALSPELTGFDLVCRLERNNIVRIFLLRALWKCKCVWDIPF